MKLPIDLLSGDYKKPRIFLCETDKTPICILDTTDTQASLRFNAYSELSCTIGRTYDDMFSGEQKVNPFYDKIEALRLLYVEGIGYFEIQDPEIVSDGVMEVKNITANGLEYTLSQKYLENFYINTGETNSIEVIYSIDNKTSVVPVRFYDAQNPQLSLLHLILEKIYGWKIGHVDATLMPMTRVLEISRASVYDFIMQDICDNFNCFVEFDTIENTINFYAESLVSKFIADGSTTSFVILPAYDQVGTVSIDGYKTTAFVYDPSTGVLTLDAAPADGAVVEVTDNTQSKWLTDVYISFDNLAQEVNISYSADNIKTVLTVKGADDLDIREVNMGLPYITDLSYYYSPAWMGQDLYDAYTAYLQKSTSGQTQYVQNSKQMLELSNYINYEEQRLSLAYSIASVTNETVGTYYVRGGTAPNYYYKEVSLPSDYSASVEYYYSLSGNDLNETKVSALYAALQTYYSSRSSKNVSKIQEQQDSFAFMETNTIDFLVSELSSANSTEEKDTAVKKFLDEMWEQLGRTPLRSLYLTPYQQLSATNIEAGWNQETHSNYWNYYPITLMLSTLNAAITARTTVIDDYQKQYDSFGGINAQISNDLLIANNFTEQQLIRLNPFLREDEYTDDNFVEVDSDTIDSLLQTKTELLECGRIELSKLCSPKLEFSMDMANIYALTEFEPIVHQFQLGNLITVALRKDYVKRARLLEVNINFDDFSDFSCEFGELTSLRTPSSIHADLLANAMQAGKSVASSASYWNKGADLATKTDLKIQQGLLDSIGALTSSTQGVRIDKNGIWLTKINPTNGEVSPYQGWIVNNNILYSSDGFRTARTGLGEFTIDGIGTFYGLLAEAVISGYIEGSRIFGGSINIGDGTFVVDEDGHVTMKASTIDGYAGSGDIISSINQSPETISIDAGRISLSGKDINLTTDDITISSTNFSVTKDGAITATSGEIAGWSIYDGLLRKETTVSGVDYQMYMQASDGVNTTNAFAVRKKNSDSTSWDTQFSVSYAGKLTAKNASVTGTITATDGSIAGYNIGSGGTYTNAIYKRVSSGSTHYEVGMKATSGVTDLAFYVKTSTDNWANSSDRFYINNSGKLYAKDADITGTINASSGTIGGCSISNGVLNVAAANITSGTIDTARIPNLSADKITAGTIHVDRIPSLNADKITVGTLNADRIPNISASKITSGTISTDRLSSSVITTGNFSSKTLSTGNLSVTNGGNIGLWTVNSNNYLYAISGNYGVSLSALSVSHGQGGSATWVNIVKAGQNASDKRLKTNIVEFDNKYDRIFDSLKPVQFEYSKDFLGEGIRFGYTAQDVIESFENEGENIENYSFIYKTEIEDGSEDQYYQLNKADFIALNTWQIQKLKARIDELEKKLAALEA